MRKVLHQRYGDLGMGEPIPSAGDRFASRGRRFVIPALLGARSSSPQTPRSPLMGYWQSSAWRRFPQACLDNRRWIWRDGVLGDLNTDGLLNAAYHLRCVDLFADFHLAPQRVRQLFEIIGELIVDMAEYVRQRTGSCSIAVNRMVERVDRRLFLHANCSVPMISPKSYQAFHLPIKLKMAHRLQPFGIHHCGDNLQRYAGAYRQLPLAFIDVGWGSDVAACRQALPETFFNLRLSPVRMLTCTPQEIASDTENLLRAAGSLELAGVCCINMDYGTPDDNLFAMYEVVERFRANH
jgi:hypothetical protein